MSKADKMFEELGYLKNENKDISIITYSGNETLIQIFLNIKSIEIASIINMQELQAINEKVKELGWI